MKISLAVAFSAFVLLGFPDGMLGVAWPSIAADAGVPIGWLGYLLIAFSAGFILAGFIMGFLVTRLGYARTFATGAAAMVAGMGLIVASSMAGLGIIAILAANTIVGFGAGIIDSGLNAFAAHYFKPKHTNWLHACYGMGATAGPLVITGILSLTGVWYWGYTIGLLPGIAIIAGFLLASQHIESTAAFGDAAAAEAIVPFATKHPGGILVADSAAAASAQIATQPDNRRLPVLLSIFIFFFYTGTEVLIGQWSYSLLTIQLHVREGFAGLAVGGYWLLFTAGRIGFGILSEHMSVTTIIARAMVGMLIGSVAILGAALTGPAGQSAALLGIWVMGVSCAPIFPLLIAETADRVGRHRSLKTVGMQVAAANLGAVGFAGIAGVLVDAISLIIVPVILVVCSIVVIILHMIIVRSRCVY